MGLLQLSILSDFDNFLCMNGSTVNVLFFFNSVYQSDPLLALGPVY